MSSRTGNILLVEDEAILSMILENGLVTHGYQVKMAEDGQVAWDILESGAQIDAILLDREMPRMDGMQLLAKLKSSERYNTIPVIMETASSDAQSIREGLSQGAYYYLTKPFNQEIMLSIVDTAVEQYREIKKMREEVRQVEHAFIFMEQGRFYFQTIEEGHMLAMLFARTCPEPEKAVMGLQELFINAVEHGNLEIGYATKTELILRDGWHQELSHRLEDPKYRNRRVEVFFERNSSQIRITIRDEGDGFDWERYLEFEAARAFDVHGRGIAMARKLSLDAIEYQGNGNTVVATVYTR